jgi:ABC-2 type transport system permease protein
MKQFFTLYKKDLLELWQTKKVLILAIVMIFFAMTSPIIAEMTPQILSLVGDAVQIIVPEVTIHDSYVQFVGNFVQVGAWTMIAVYAGSIANEKKRGLFTNLVSNGVKKYNFVFSKIESQILVMSLIYGVSILLFSLYNYIIFEQFFLFFSWMTFLAIWIYLIFIICLTNFYSVVTKSGGLTILLSITTMLMFGIFDLFAFGKYLPNYLLSISTGVLEDASMLDYAWWTILATMGISIVLVFLSVKLLKNKE